MIKGEKCMKHLFKKTWFIGTIMILLMLTVFFTNLWMMSLRLTDPYQNSNFFSLARNLSIGGYVNIYAFVMVVLFYTSIIAFLFTIFSFFRKNHLGYIIAMVFFLGFEVALIVFQTSFNYISLFGLILIIFNILLIMATFVLFVFRKKALMISQNHHVSDNENRLVLSGIPLYIFIINTVSLLIFLSTFFIPIFSYGEADSAYHAILIRVLLFGDTNIPIIIYFLANFAILLSIFIYYATTLTSYYFDKERFVNQSKMLTTFVFISTVIFFISGLAFGIYYTLQGEIAQTYAFIPMLAMSVVIFIYSVFKGKYHTFSQLVERKVIVKYAKIEPLLYVFLLTAVTVMMLLLAIVKIDVTLGSFSYFVDLTGIEILRDYAFLDPGYRIIAYILVVMLISIGLCLVVAISGYLARYNQFNSIVKLAASVNVFFVFIIAISGYYFQIAKEINVIVIMDIFSFYGFSLPGGFDFVYTISTDAIYALMGSVAVLILMFVRKAFDREELNVLETSLLPMADTMESSQSSPLDKMDEESFAEFDPCPAFTDLDSKIEGFKQDLEKRKALKTNGASLNQLVHFIVEYARNSRLHLSYTPEDIATFVAGLGSSKLSILQGMSGTGKTSLPKIFAEAIFANCEIIEVESSWKDKNELLGYYNEFSMKYTPKKFTLALYKAALNQEIMTFILLDEMNLSRIEYYFSDFLSLMEHEENYREIKLINIKLNRKEEDQDIDYLALEHGNTLKVPANVWFIGTANRDESTFVISDKVYDRAHTMNFTKRAPKVRNYTNPISKQYYDVETINLLFARAKQNGNFDAEKNELIQHVEALLAPFNISFGNRILKQIEDFVNIYKVCFSNDDVENEAIEKILLSKVVAKLEVKTIDDKEKLEMEFEKLNLKQCAAFIRRLDNE
jgi:hypothetical protein